MAIANIVLADAQATPVSHTFVPVGRDANGVLWFEDQSAAAPIGNWKISLALKRPSPPKPGESSANRQYRPQIALHMPTLEVVSNSTVSGIQPAPTLAYTCRAANGDMIIPERASVQNRKDLRKMWWNLQNDPQVVNLVENLILPVG